MKRLLALLLLLPALAWGQVPIWTKPSGTASGVSSAAFPLLAPDGAIGAPSYSFANDTQSGFFRSGSGLMAWAMGGNRVMECVSTQLGCNINSSLGWGSAGPANPDVFLFRDGVGVLAQKNATAAMEFRIYGTTTGPKFLSLKHDGTNATIDTVGALFIGSSATTTVVLGTSAHATGTQLRTAQLTAPTCTTNCGTSPSVAGTDTAGIITLGTTPASAFQLNFNSTWTAVPSCVVQSALTSMVVGKMPIAVAVTTTTVIVTTNGTAPSTSDKYQYHCIGVS